MFAVIAPFARASAPGGGGLTHDGGVDRLRAIMASKNGPVILASTPGEPNT